MTLRVLKPLKKDLKEQNEGRAVLTLTLTHNNNTKLQSCFSNLHKSEEFRSANKIWLQQ